MMNRILFFLAGTLFLALTACNNGDKKTTGDDKMPSSVADSLMKDIDDGHMAAMSKMGRLTSTTDQVQAALDSVSKLSANASLTAYKTALTTSIGELKTAKDAMEKWMEEFNMDSLTNNTEERVKYLIDEKGKVLRMKDMVLSSLQHADSLLKANH